MELETDLRTLLLSVLLISPRRMYTGTAWTRAEQQPIVLCGSER